MSKNQALQMVVMAVVGIALCGCDKCGHPVKLNTPTIQHACDDSAGSAR